MALQVTTPKVSPKRLMSLDHKPKMRWRTLGFVVILCEYGLLLKKLLSMNMREVINMGRELWFIVWAQSICWCWWYHGLWSQLMKRKCGPWIHLLKKDLTGHVSPIHVIEWNMSLFWVLNRFTQKINNMLMWHGLPMK